MPPAIKIHPDSNLPCPEYKVFSIKPCRRYSKWLCAKRCFEISFSLLVVSRWCWFFGLGTVTGVYYIWILRFLWFEKLMLLNVLLYWLLQKHHYLRIRKSAWPATCFLIQISCRDIRISSFYNVRSVRFAGKNLWEKPVALKVCIKSECISTVCLTILIVTFQ